MAVSSMDGLLREEKILNLVRDLAFAITERDASDDDQIKAFVENSAIALGVFHAPMLNKKAQQDHVDSLALKFTVHGFPHLSDRLLSGVKEIYEMENVFLNVIAGKHLQQLTKICACNLINKSETPCNMIDLITKLSWKPLEYAQQLAMGEIEPDESVVPTLVKEFDWPAYVKEGNLSFHGNLSDTDSDAWSQLSEEEEDEVGLEVLYINQVDSESSSLSVQPSQESIITAPTLSQTNFREDTAGLFQYSNDPFVTKTNFILNPSPREAEQTSSREEIAVSVNSKATLNELDPCAQQLKQRFQISYESKQVIDSEIQDGDWFTPETMITNPETPSLDLGDQSEACQLTEWQILREILWMLQAPTNCRCFGMDASGKFRPRPDFTVVDVNMLVTWHFLEHYCGYFDMVNEIEQFAVGLDNGNKEPPATYRVYFRALEEHLAEFKEGVARVMHRIVQQEETETLISLIDELEPSLKRLEFVIALHRKATCDWNESPNWLSAIRLLSVLYWTVTESVRTDCASVAADLFLKSFQPYVTIIDNLLTLGKCTDVHQEFIIYRADDLDSSMRESWDEGFYVRPYARALRAAGINALSMLDNVVADIVVGCKSVYVVARMDALSKSEDYQTKCTLYKDLIARLENEFSRNVNLSDSLVDFSEEPSNAPDKSTTIMSANEILTDHWLSLAFGRLLHSDKNENNQNKESDKFKHPSERLKQYTSKDTIRYQSIFERVFRDLISTKYNVLGKLINAVMRNDVQIGKHLKALRAVFMIEAGQLMAICYDCLVKKEKDEPYWLYSHYLASDIEDYFVKSFPGCNNFQVSVDKRFVDDNILEAIDGIELTYKADWPLSFIINRANLEVYNDIFKMLLKLKMTLTSLERLHFAVLDPPGSRKKKTSAVLMSRLSRWHLLRFQLISVLRGVHCFAMNHIKHTFGPELDEHVESANDFDLFVQVHTNYLQTVYELCLNPLCNPALAGSFSKLLDLAHCCVDLWPFGRRQAIDDKLTDLEETYKLIHRHINSELQEYKPSDSRLHIDGLQALFY